MEWLAHNGGGSPDLLRAHAYTLQDDEAARRRLRVASDSMVLGEPQTRPDEGTRCAPSGRRSHGLTDAAPTFPPFLPVRTKAQRSAPTASALWPHAVRLAGQLFEDLKTSGAGFAGEMIDLAATLCRPKAMAIANRTLERGEKLATRFVPRSCAWPTCPAACTSSMPSSAVTASTLPIIGLGPSMRALKLRKHRPMFMVDLAVPRDIESEVKASDALTPLMTWRMVQTGRDSRQAAVAEAEVIIDAGA
jgi:glutamyl-tRNA reductase